MELLLVLSRHQHVVEKLAELELGDGQVAIVHHLDGSLRVCCHKKRWRPITIVLQRKNILDLLLQLDGMQSGKLLQMDVEVERVILALRLRLRVVQVLP